MKITHINPAPHGITRRAGLLTLLGSALAIAGCGGGGDGGIAAVGAGGTGSFSVGPIRGFGSIIVNGVRFDDDGAKVRNDDDDDNIFSRSRSELKLGMMVAVIGSSVTGSRATANNIVFGSELVGPISATTANPQTLTVLGQTVEITGSTIFDATSLSGGFASLVPGNIVEVHGVVNQVTNSIQATLIEKKRSASVYKIQGLVKNLNSGSSTFTLGTGATAIKVSYLGTSDVRVALDNDVSVRVRLQPVSPAPEVWTATRIRPPENHATVSRGEVEIEAEIEGSVTAFTSDTQFSVNGIPVTTSSTTRFDDVTTGLAVGVRVEVKGRLRGGVLIAERVKIEDDNDVDELEFELHGTVSNVTPTTFTLTSSGGVAVNVSYSSALITGLINGSSRVVEVKGTASDATITSTVIVATSIKFETN